MVQQYAAVDGMIAIERSGISKQAADDIRLGFNPSGLSNVEVTKILAGALLTHIENMAAGTPPVGGAARALAVARTHVQTASMWAVMGATA